MSYMCLENLLPTQLWTPQLKILLKLGDKCILYSFESDEFYVPSSISATSSSISSILDAAIDDNHIRECLSRINMGLRHNNYLQRYTMSEVRASLNRSIYQGVIRVTDQHFEAFVWDNTSTPSGKTVYVGGYSTEIEAARAHDLVSIKLYGLHTVTNLPVGCYTNEIYDMQMVNTTDFIIKVRWNGNGNYSGIFTPYRGVYRMEDNAAGWGAWLSDWNDNECSKIFLGTYDTAEEAARAYDIVLIKFKGMDAIINFELSSYDIKSILYTNSKPSTAKKVPTYNDILMNKVTVEALSSPSNTYFQSQPLKLTLSNSSLSTFCANNQNPNSFQLICGTGLSGARTSNIAINGNNTSLSMLSPSQRTQQSQTQLVKLGCGRLQNMKKRSYREASSSSSSFHNEQLLNKQMRMSSSNYLIYQSNPAMSGAMYPNPGANVEQPLIQNIPVFTLPGLQNHNLMQSCSGNLGGLTGIGSRIGADDNSIGNIGAMIPNPGANVEQPLAQTNSALTLQGSQNLNLMQSCSYNHGGLIGTGSRAGTLENAIGNGGAMIPNPGTNVGHPLGIGRDFQSPTQGQHYQLSDIINEFHKYIHNSNQSLPQSPNLSFSDCNFTEFQSDFEIQLSPVVGTGLQAIDTEATETQEHDDADIFMINQPVPQSPSLTLVQHDGNQNLGLKNDLTSNIPTENSSKPSFSTSFVNLHEEMNTTSNGNMIMTEKQDGLGSSQCVSNLNDLFHNPMSETNTGSQILTPGSQNDMNITDYLNDCAVEEESEWIRQFGADLGLQ